MKAYSILSGGCLALILLLSGGCASTPPEMLPANNIVPPADLEVSDVKNEDFRPVKTIRYRANQDNFSGLEVLMDSLVRESWTDSWF